MLVDELGAHGKLINILCAFNASCLSLLVFHSLWIRPKRTKSSKENIKNANIVYLAIYTHELSAGDAGVEGVILLTG